MYTLLQAFKNDSKIKNKWVEIADLAALLNTNIEMVNTVFGKVQLILTHNTEPTKKLRYDFVRYRREVTGQPPLTLSEWLTLAAGINLTTTVFTGIKVFSALYADLIEAGFRIETTYPAGIPNFTQTDEYRTDALISLPVHLLPEMVIDNCLFSVAGYLHMPYATTNGVYLRDAGTTLNRSNLNTAGVISFANLGGVKCHPITPNMLSGLPLPTDHIKRLRKPVYVKLEDFNPSTQTAFLSLMGVMIPLGDIFKEVGNGLFEINLVRYDYLMTYLRADRSLGFAAIKEQIERSKNAPTLISLYDAASYEFLKGILTCSQSFIGVINSPGVYFNREKLETTQNSMSFLSNQPVYGPVVDEEGILLEYLQSKDLDTYVLDTVPTDRYVPRSHSTGAVYNEDSVDFLPRHLKQMRRSSAFELFISKAVF